MQKLALPTLASYSRANGNSSQAPLVMQKTFSDLIGDSASAALVGWANGHDPKMKLSNYHILPTLPLPLAIGQYQLKIIVYNSVDEVILKWQK